MEDRLLNFIRDVYNSMSWPGVVLLMAIESACIPLPSEIIMPLAGWLLIQAPGHSAWLVFAAALFGALGNLIGSLATYWVGSLGGRPLLNRYGKYVLVSQHDVEAAERWFAKHGDIAIFVSRLLPVVRTFISLPAGVARVNLVKFCVYTFTGAFIFSLGLAYGGYKLGEHWDKLRNAMRPFDIPLAVIIVLLIAFYVWRHARRAWGRPADSPKET